MHTETFILLLAMTSAEEIEANVSAGVVNPTEIVKHADGHMDDLKAVH